MTRIPELSTYSQRLGASRLPFFGKGETRVVATVGALAWLVGCSPDAIDAPGQADPVLAAGTGGDEPTGTTIPGVLVDSPLMVHDIWETASASWLPTVGLGLVSARLVGDMDGDGYVDALVSTQDLTSGAYETLFIRGPLVKSMVLPGDEDARLTGASVRTTGDVTGDGLPDFDVATLFSVWIVPAALFVGEVDYASVGKQHSSQFLMDVNGDDILDRLSFGMDWFEHTEAELDIIWGPLSRFDGEPDVIIRPKCEGATTNDWDAIRPVVYPDLDGDGTRELWMQGFYAIDNPECSNLLVPVPTEGIVDPLTMDNAYVGVRPGSVVPDQDGDGTQEFLNWGREDIVMGLVTYADDGVSGLSSLVVDPSLGNLLGNLIPLDVDLTGDGVADFLATLTDVVPAGEPVYESFVLASALVVVAGGGDLTVPTEGDAWDLEAGALGIASSVFIEDGHAYLLVREFEKGVAVLDLGAATPAK